MAQVIAELERSHRGDLDLAARMIAEAKRCNADYAKVQVYQTKFLRPGDPAEAALKEAELDERGIRFLAQVCKDEGIKFLATVFDPERVPLIRELSDEVKIGSGEGADISLIEACEAAQYSRIFVGHGLADPIWGTLFPFACVTAYPAPPIECMAECAILAQCTDASDGWGYSDHAIGLDCCEFALALGASFIETHVALGVDKRGAYEKNGDELRSLCEMAHGGDVPLVKRANEIREAARARYEGRWSHGR